MVIRTVVVAAGVLLCVAACGGGPAGVAASTPASPRPPTTTRSAASGRRLHHHRSAMHHGGRHGRTARGALLAVHDPDQVTGTLTGPCRTRDGGLLPDPACTPGAIDPAVTQANIGSTICKAGYTDSVRPPESQTESFKWNVAEPAYGQHDLSGELDHLVPLELGGDNDARNLWVEAGPLPNPKDAVEDALNRAVCDGTMTLRAAQDKIAANWIKAAAALGVPVHRPSSSPPAGRAAWCTTTASYSAQYADWDVYVHSNQPDAAVTVSSGSHSHSWHTDASGYADVYLRGPSPGQTITVTAGHATCSTTAG